MNLFSKVAAVALAASVVCANCSAKTRLAPADEYFGRMKMSVLEIHNRLCDLDRRVRVGRPQERLAILHDAGLVRDSIRDWKHKYPADPWLTQDLTSLIHIYAHYRAILSHDVAH